MQRFCKVPAYFLSAHYQNVTPRVIIFRKYHPRGNFLEEKSPGGVTFQEKLVGWSYPHFAKIPWNMQPFCRVPAIPGARAAQLLRSRHLFSENITRGVTFLMKKSSGGVTFQESWSAGPIPTLLKNDKEYVGFQRFRVRARRNFCSRALFFQKISPAGSVFQGKVIRRSNFSRKVGRLVLSPLC